MSYDIPNFCTKINSHFINTDSVYYFITESHLFLNLHSSYSPFPDEEVGFG